MCKTKYYWGFEMGSDGAVREPGEGVSPESGDSWSATNDGEDSVLLRICRCIRHVPKSRRVLGERRIQFVGGKAFMATYVCSRLIVVVNRISRCEQHISA